MKRKGWRSPTSLQTGRLQCKLGRAESFARVRLTLVRLMDADVSSSRFLGHIEIQCHTCSVRAWRSVAEPETTTGCVVVSEVIPCKECNTEKTKSVFSMLEIETEIADTYRAPCYSLSG